MLSTSLKHPWHPPVVSPSPPPASPSFLCLLHVVSVRAFDWICCSELCVCVGEVGADSNRSRVRLAQSQRSWRRGCSQRLALARRQNEQSASSPMICPVSSSSFFFLKVNSRGTRHLVHRGKKWTGWLPPEGVKVLFVWLLCIFTPKILVARVPRWWSEFTLVHPEIYKTAAVLQPKRIITGRTWGLVTVTDFDGVFTMLSLCPPEAWMTGHRTKNTCLATRISTKQWVMLFSFTYIFFCKEQSPPPFMFQILQSLNGSISHRGWSDIRI